MCGGMSLWFNVILMKCLFSYFARIFVRFLLWVVGILDISPLLVVCYANIVLPPVAYLTSAFPKYEFEEQKIFNIGDVQYFLVFSIMLCAFNVHLRNLIQSHKYLLLFTLGLSSSTFIVSVLTWSFPSNSFLSCEGRSWFFCYCYSK